MFGRALYYSFTGIILAAALSALAWSTWIVKSFHLSKPYWHDLKAAGLVAFTAPNVRPITIVSIVGATLVAAVVSALFCIFGSPYRKPKTHVRGVDIVKPPVLRQLTDDNAWRNRFRRMASLRAFGNQDARRALTEPVKQLEIAGVPIPRHLEVVGFIIGGTPGSGKSVAIKDMVSIARERGDRLIICDPNAEYYSYFGRPRDIVLNPFDKRSPGWSPFNEVRIDYDAERFARSAIPDGRSAADAEWHGYAQFLYQETLLYLKRDGHRSTDTLIHYLCQLPIDQLGLHLRDTMAIGLFDQGAAKALSSTRFILTKYLSSYKHLRDGDFSLRDWLEQGDGSLFITWRQDMADALRPLISAWFDILISSTLSLPVKSATYEPPRLWAVCDEWASMERLSSLEEGATKGRKHGLGIIGGIQSTAQLDDIYGKEKAQTLRSCFRNALYLNIPSTDPMTAEEFSKGIGEREYMRVEKSRGVGGGRGATVSTRTTHVRDRAVMPAEIHALPDLTGYLCLAGEYPVSKVTMTGKSYPVRNKPFVEDGPAHTIEVEPRHYIVPGADPAPAVPVVTTTFEGGHSITGAHCNSWREAADMFSTWFDVPKPPPES